MLKNKRLVIKLLSKFKNNILKSKFANLMINGSYTRKMPIPTVTSTGVVLPTKWLKPLISFYRAIAELLVC